MTGKGKAEEAKQRGNDHFKKAQYAEAVGSYTEAILADASNHVYYLNRSMAYMKLGKFEDAERDASASLRLGSGNVKAFFRRGTARKNLSKWGEAKGDFEEVLRLDPTNSEAKAEIMAMQEKLAVVKAASKTTPLDANDMHPRNDSAIEGKSKSSVEAARSFLEKVGVTDEQGTAPPTVSNNIPDRFPGETGSFLREVSTRKLVKKPTEQITASPAPSSAGPITVATSISTSGSSVEEPKTISSASAAPHTSSGNGSTSKVKLSAYEFYRRLRRCSASSDPAVKYTGQLELLASLDIQSIPSMLGSLLEPELLADILEALSQDDSTQRDLQVDMMSVLPQCERFETAYLFLEQKEKQRAVDILERIKGEVGSTTYDLLAMLWKIHSTK